RPAASVADEMGFVSRGALIPG
ncbi:MAG: hypothetical protein JWM35_664, partial [Verrucomicrobia bacterium]|nr:hypothetical protein [Verrucomicrobiota bacterium]